MAQTVLESCHFDVNLRRQHAKYAREIKNNFLNAMGNSGLIKNKVGQIFWNNENSVLHHN